MKKLVSLVLAIMMLLMAVPAMAEGLSISGSEILFAKNGQNSWSANTEHSAAKKLVQFELSEAATVQASIYNSVTGELYTGVANASYEAGKVTLMWNGVNTQGWHPDQGDSINLLLRIYASNENGSVVEDIPFSFYSAHNMSSHQETVIPEFAEDVLPPEQQFKPVPTTYDAKWYPHNTICVAGVEFRDVRPELTDKWYNFAAIDLSQDGVQVYDLVASNMYIIGSVIVTKSGDEVTVDWQLNLQGTTDANFQLEDEFLTFFSDLNAVTEVDPAKYEGPSYEFGQTISIANDLGGDTNVLLYILNQATYCNNLSYKYQKPIYHTRYWPNLEYRIAEREAMMELVNADLNK